MLYARELHEPLTEMPWNEAQARNAVQAIVADTERAYSAEALWPAHEWDGYGAALPLNTFYVGAAGVVWALQRLRTRGYESTLDLPTVAQRAVEQFRAAPDYVARAGATPSRPLLALHRLDGRSALRRRLHRRARTVPGARLAGA